MKTVKLHVLGYLVARKRFSRVFTQQALAYLLYTNNE